MEAGLLDAAPIWTDLKTFPWEEFRDRVDILSGGYPCQPFSAAGKRLGKDDPRHLWPFIADGIALMRPSICFFENVEGHISMGLSDVMQDLGRLGYRSTWGIFSASEVGAPHQRKRVFILAYRINEGSQRLPWDVSNWSQPGWNDQEPSGSTGKSSLCIWPSRPGQPQYKWEPPRVVGNAKHDGLSPKSFVRGNEEASNDWGKEKSTEAGEFEGTDRSLDVLGIQGGTSGGEQLESERGGVAHSKLLGWRGGSHGDEGGCSREIQVEGSCGSLGYAEGRSNGQLTTQQQGGYSIGGSMQEGGEMGNADHGGQSPSLYTRSSCEENRGGENNIEQTESRQTQRTVGRNFDESSRGMGYAELSVTCDNRTDELRLLGNGVVAATATLAFRTLLKELTNS